MFKNTLLLVKVSFLVSGDNQTLILLISKEKDETLSENEEVSENESENANGGSSDGEDQSSPVSYITINVMLFV